MIEKLQQLYTTMLLIETKGQSTKIMGDCLKFTEQMIQELDKERKEKEDANKDSEPAA